MCNVLVSISNVIDNAMDCLQMLLFICSLLQILLANLLLIIIILFGFRCTLLLYFLIVVVIFILFLLSCYKLHYTIVKLL